MSVFQNEFVHLLSSVQVRLLVIFYYLKSDTGLLNYFLGFYKYSEDYSPTYMSMSNYVSNINIEYWYFTKNEGPI